jgi:hypothetical protein
MSGEGKKLLLFVTFLVNSIEYQVWSGQSRSRFAFQLMLYQNYAAPSGSATLFITIIFHPLFSAPLYISLGRICTVIIYLVSNSVAEPPHFYAAPAPG